MGRFMDHCEVAAEPRARRWGPLELSSEKTRSNLHDASDRSGADVRLIFEGRYEEYIAEAREPLGSGEASPSLRHNLAVAYYKIGDFPHARELLDALLDEDDTRARAHYLLGLVERDDGEDPKAVQAFSRTIELCDDFAAAYISRGLSLYRLGKLREAVKDFEKAIDVQPSSVSAHYNLAAAHVALEDWHRAKDAFSQCLRLDPFHRDDYLTLLCDIGRAQAYGELSCEAHRMKNVIAMLGCDLKALCDRLAASVPDDLRATLSRSMENYEQLYSAMAAHLSQMNVMPVELELADLHELIDAALVAAEGPLAHVRVERRYDQAISEILCEPFMLKEAFLNVILNACEATDLDKGGTLAVTTRRDEEGAITIEFADTGRGMRPADLARVFEHGFTTKPLGNGMGLPYVRRTAQKRGGAVRIESAKGRGTTLTMTFPENAPQDNGITSLSVRASLSEDPSTLVSEETPPDDLLIDKEIRLT